MTHKKLIRSILCLFSLLGLSGAIGCLGGSGATRGATSVTLSGTVSTLGLGGATSEDAGLSVQGMVLNRQSKFVEKPATGGTVTLMNSEGKTLDIVTVQSDGTYTTSLPASQVQGETLVLVYENDQKKSEPEIHSYDVIPSTATSATINCNTETDFSTAVLLAVAENETGKSYEVGGDLTGALEVVVPDAIKQSVEAVIGDTTITSNTTIDTANVGIEAAYQAHQQYIAEGGTPSITAEPPTPPVEVLKDAIQGESSAISAISAEVLTVGGGIPVDTNVFGTTLRVTDTIYEAYAKKSDAAVVADWETIKGSLGTVGLKAYIGPIVEVKPEDLANQLIKPTDLRQCAKYITAMDSSVAKAFGDNSKAREAIVEQIKIGACDDPDEAKFVMGALGGAIPAPAADGTYDFSSFVPTTVAQASHVIGLDLKNKIDPSQYATYGVADLAKSCAPQMRDSNVVQTCALTGTAGCANLISGIINYAPGTILGTDLVTIPKPPGADCTSGSCTTGTQCTTQSSGSRTCAALSEKLGRACSTNSDCDVGITFCNLAKICMLTAGATTGMGSIATGGEHQSFGGGGAAPTVASSGSAGGSCSSGACEAGSSCQAGVCVSTTVTILSGPGFSCSSSATCGTGLTCTNGTCQGSDAGGGGLKALAEVCASNTQCGSNCCSGGLCATSASCGGGGLKGLGEACTENTACGSACCSGGICSTSASCSGSGSSLKGLGDGCVTNTECGSACCSAALCSTSTACATSCTSNCSAGTRCTSDATCASGYCGLRSLSTSPGTCAGAGSGATGEYCGSSGHCSSGLTCTGNICTAGGLSCSAVGLTCTSDANCCSTYCGGGTATRACKNVGAGIAGDVCSTPGQCMSGLTCIATTCQGGM